MPTQLAAPAHRPNRRLTTRQREFAKKYVSNGFNGAKAAIAAGYSEKIAREVGSVNLTKCNIRQLIDAELADRGANRDRLLQGYLDHAFLEVDSSTTPAMVALKSKCMETLTRVLALERKQDDAGAQMPPFMAMLLTPPASPETKRIEAVVTNPGVKDEPPRADSPDAQSC